ncbi:hypothetical protein [Streptomyces sp. NPDC093089]|uniref:hypothetical protein n=1 Tax=Streptomyces sp. NPDC093089 TaxID=3366024 RepID=UPI00382D3674
MTGAWVRLQATEYGGCPKGSCKDYLSNLVQQLESLNEVMAATDSEKFAKPIEIMQEIPDSPIDDIDSKRESILDIRAQSKSRLSRHPEEATGLGFPLGAYRLSPEEDMVLQQGVDALVTDCMARYGFQYKPAPARTPSGQSRSRIHGVTESRSHGVTEEREARSYGYRNPEQSRPKNSGNQAGAPDESACSRSGPPT